MLRAMQQEAVESGAGAGSFAGLLASLTAPKPRAWSGEFDGLQDDVATLSYERALHTHARYKPAAAEAVNFAVEHPVAAGMSAAQAGVPQSNCERSGKRASITVRMSKAECTQLQRRAAEAGMTVSAYLRSCTFEAEALRAQVKQALAELRAAQQAPHRGWLRLFRRRRGAGAGFATGSKTKTAS